MTNITKRLLSPLLLLCLSYCYSFGQNIVELEYFFGTDPGLGQATAIALTPGSDIADEIVTINASSVTNGSQILHLRTLDDSGKWSITTQHLINKRSADLTENITTLEYFFGNDPGIGEATTVAMTPASNQVNQSVSINVSGIANGSHILNLRTFDDSGAWSITTAHSMHKSDPPSLGNINEFEYFFDNDPGFGNGQTISVSGTQDISDFMPTLSANSLSNGSHTFMIRSKTDNGIWSHLATALILKIDPIVIANIERLEYYFGNDPGFGNGQNISVTPANNIINLSPIINTASLPAGTNVLSIRSIDSEGRWSHVISQAIFSLSSPVTDISKLEYYFGNDPGKGNAINVPVTPGVQLTNINIPISASTMPSMINLLSIRSMSVDGKWSLNHQAVIAKQDPTIGVMESIEYYFDQDPGKGNGTTIDPADLQDVSDLLSLVNSSGLDRGAHSLSFRSFNDKNQWSHDQHFLVLKLDPDSVKDIVAAEYFVDDDPGIGSGTAINLTDSPELTVIEMIDESTLDSQAKELHVRTQDVEGNWSHNTVHLLKKRVFATSHMQEGEYFFDTDPGFGLASSFTLPEEIDLSDLNVIVMTAGLTPGMHDLYVRTKSLDQKWSLTNVEIDLVVEAALPLTWLDFSIEKLSRESLLQWSVAAAINTSHFEVERQNGQDYEVIGHVTTVDQEDELNYEFLDNKVEDGWNYYRINQIDMDGHSSYSEVRGVFFDEALSISVFPNPTTEKIMIQGASEDKVTYKLYNANLGLIQIGEVANKEQINLSNYTAGSYILLVENGKNTQTFLIIKQ